MFFVDNTFLPTAYSCPFPYSYTIDHLSEAEIQRVIDSIGDNEAYLAFNSTPVAHIIDILKDSFDPKVRFACISYLQTTLRYVPNCVHLPCV